MPPKLGGDGTLIRDRLRRTWLEEREEKGPIKRLPCA